MLKSRQEEIHFLVRILDILIAVIAFFLAYAIRTSSWFFNRYGMIDSWESLSWLLAVSLVLHSALYPYFQFYESLRLKRIIELVRMAILSAITEFFVLGGIIFFVHAKETSRYFFGFFVLFNYLIVILVKVGAKILLGVVRQRGYNFRQVLIIGGGMAAELMIQTLRTKKYWGYIPFGILLTEADSENLTHVKGVPVLGKSESLREIVKSQVVDEVFFALDHFERTKFISELSLCQDLGVPVRLTFGDLGMPGSKQGYLQVGGVSLLSFYNTVYMTPIQTALKRITDIVIALLGLALTALLYPWIVYRIRKESSGPVIFKQIRIGQNGRRFKCYKFRTMELDAENRKQELFSFANEMEGPIFKMTNDPRVFPFGAFLRKTSLDELPQFLNILRGEMSAVGTRPPTPDEVERYKDHYRRRLSIRPGLTGLWQISGRNLVKNFDDVLILDLKYIDNWSISLDLRIIFKTLWMVFHRQGAY